MATIRERSGSYQITISLGRDANDKQIKKSFTYHPKASTPARIKREVEQYARDLESRIRDGEYYSGERMTFAEAVEEWFEHYANERITKGTLESYRDLLSRRILPTLGRMKLCDIRTAHIQSMYDRMKAEGLSSRSIKRISCPVSGVFKYCYRMEIIENNPHERIYLPKAEDKKELHCFTLEQAKRFLNALDGEFTFTHRQHDRVLKKTNRQYHVPAYTETHRLHPQWKAYFSIAIYGGLRRGETVALTWNDIDFENGSISITKSATHTSEGQSLKGTKTSAGVRCITMPKQCLDDLRRWKRLALQMAMQPAWRGYRGKEFDNNFVFIQEDGRMMHLDSPKRMFDKAITYYNATCENEADRLPKIRLHDLRHTCASLLISEGCDVLTVANRLGHKNVSVTLDIYSHALESKDKVASEILSRMFA